MNPTAEILSAKLRRINGGKDPNDLELAGVLKDAVREAIDEAQAAKRGRFPFLYPEQMVEVEHDEELIESWLPEGGIHLLYAPKDCFKSFLAVDWFLCVASGRAWNGWQAKQGPAIYIAGEGNHGLRRRFNAWCIRHRIAFESLPIAVSQWPMQALDADNVAQWSEHIAEVEAHYGAPARFVVVDTLATNFGPGDENAPTDMARFLAMLAIHIKRSPSTTILVVHHSGKDESRGARGGSSIEGNAEAVFTLARVKDSERAVELACKHIKDGEKPPTMRLIARTVELGTTDRHGDPLTSLVLDMELTEREQRVLDNLKAGKSMRDVAQLMGLKSHTPVARMARRLRQMGRLE
jgi:RecA-family ATPase